MKFEKLFLAAAVVIFIFSTAVIRADQTDSATLAWETLTNFSLSSPPMSWATNPPTPTNLNQFDDHRAAESITHADEARDFYTRFPNDTNAASARITEIQALQMAVHLGETNQLGRLTEREQFIIENTNAPTELRYELRLDQIGRELKNGPASGTNTTAKLAQMENVGRGLVKEFPTGPVGYELLLDVAESSDLIKMQQLAKVMANSGGSKKLTNIGKGLLNQISAVGEPLPVAFTTADGRQINTTTLSNKVVLVDFWATWCPLCIAEMPKMKNLYDQYHAKGFEIIGVNFDSNTNQARQFIQKKSLPWPQYFGGYGEANQYGREFGGALPYVWLVDKNGIVQDIHGRKNTEAKIRKLLGIK